MGVKTAKSHRTQKQQKKVTAKPHHKHRILKWFAIIIGVIVLLVLAVYISFKVSPWPSALLIRREFDQNDAKVAKALEKHVPSGIASVQNLQYRPDDKDAYLDVFYPQDAAQPLPTVVWVHGGAWVSGNKDDIDNYLKILASHGYTTVSINYSIAPEKQYPVPVLQVNDALGYLQQHAQQLHIDAHNIALAGDSAGSQIVAQVATVITNPAYAKEMGVQPKLPAANLKAMLLSCGAYDLNLPDYNGEFGGFLHTVLWAYSGKQDFLSDPAIRHASVVNYVTKDYPPTFLTAGNADPLLNQSEEFAKKLSSLGVPADTLFYPKDHQPQLQHEYQFNLDLKDGERALKEMVAFLQQHVK